MVENLPSNAGDMSSTPGRGIKIPPTVGQLSTGTTTTVPMCLNSREAHLPQGKVLNAATKTQ